MSDPNEARAGVAEEAGEKSGSEALRCEFPHAQDRVDLGYELARADIGLDPPAARRGAETVGEADERRRIDEMGSLRRDEVAPTVHCPSDGADSAPDQGFGGIVG